MYTTTGTTNREYATPPVIAMIIPAAAKQKANMAGPMIPAVSLQSGDSIRVGAPFTPTIAPSTSTANGRRCAGSRLLRRHGG
jgi:hypothetical protein